MARGHNIERSEYLRDLERIENLSAGCPAPGATLTPPTDLDFIQTQDRDKYHDCRAQRRLRPPRPPRQCSYQSENWRYQPQIYLPTRQSSSRTENWRDHPPPPSIPSLLEVNPLNWACHSGTTSNIPGTVTNYPTSNLSPHYSRKRSASNVPLPTERKYRITHDSLPNIAVKRRKLMRLEYSIRKMSGRQNFTEDSFEDNLNTAYTVPIVQNSARRKYRRFDN